MTSAYAADPVFEANGKQVSYLLQRIHDRELAIPDFQRDFVWETKATLELIRSIMSRYPAGTLLFWKQAEGSSAFAARSVEGAPQLGDKVPDELVLDGQQRMTSLYRALVGTPDENYFVYLRYFVDAAGACREVHDVEFEDALVAFDTSSKNKIDTDNLDWQYENGAFPLAKLGDFQEWLDGFAEASCRSSDERAQLKKQMRAVHDAYLVPLRSYGFPVVTLPSSTPLDAVCNIFETLNRTGKPLGAFDLVTARIYPDGVNLRELWEKAKDEHGILEDYGVDPYSLLQAVCLRSYRSAQRADVLRKLSAEDLRDHWPAVASGAAAVLDNLQNNHGVIGKRLMPYTMLLVPMAAVWPEVRELKPLERGKALERLSRYFWCTTFMTNFDQGANSQAGADYIRLSEWLHNENAVAPEAVRDFALTDSVLRTASVRRKALHAGVMALTIRSGGKDFHTAQKLTPAKASEKKVDSHHVFPKAYLGKSSNSELLLNRALIDSETNKIIGKKAPSEYLKEMRDAYGSEKLIDVLESHAIQTGDDSGIEGNSYENFLEERLTAVIALVEEATAHSVVRE